MIRPAGGPSNAARHVGVATARHRGAERSENFSSGFAALAQLALSGVSVSARATDLVTGRVLLSVDDHVVLPTASIGKVLLLIELSARITVRDASGLGILDRTAPDLVGGTGLWQHLQAPALPIVDIAALVGSVSDNIATNVLLRHIGLDAVRTRAESLGLSKTALLDVARDSRGPDDAPQLSVGSATELTQLFSALVRGEVVDPDTSERVVSWLNLNTDQSLVASAFGLDPLAHQSADHGLAVTNKAGRDRGVIGEVGVVRGGRAGATYAVLTHFSDSDLPVRLQVLEAMRAIGGDLLEYVY